MENKVIVIHEKKSPVFSLPFGGSSPNGQTLEINSGYLLKDGNPWFPVMGEFHYSRYPAKYWEESLCKIRAGGIQIVSSYIFWIYHEEEKGVWDFSGQRDLRRFIELCSKQQLLVFLRIGPWAHGECRNGGFPDWLHNDPSIKTRTNDPVYLDLARNFFEKIYEQAKGLLWKDGGPVIGVQIENEYGHVGGLAGAEGLEHMRSLKKTAKAAGFDVPFYTATGWGGAVVADKETLPVQGGYADAPWEKHTNELPANENFLIMPFSGKPGEEFTYNIEDYPYLTAELGCGIQITLHRRPVISADDIAAMALCKLASGANMLGYYMYHGGTHPNGKFSTLQETTATGSWSDLPVLTYDFQTCIGEYGEVNQSYRKLKKLHMLLKCFGGFITLSAAFFPEDTVADPEDTVSLRYCARHNEDANAGFLFVNNHQRRRKMKSHQDVKFSVALSDETICFPQVDIPQGFYGIFPYNIKLGKSLLKSTNAQLLCKLKDQYVFYCHEKPIFNWEGEPAIVILLSEEEADNSWLLGDKLFITKGSLSEIDRRIYLSTCETEENVVCYMSIYEKETLTYTFPPVCVNSGYKEIYRDDTFAEYEIKIDNIPQTDINDMFLIIDFSGDRAELFRNGAMIADWYAIGLPWRVSLRCFDYEENFTIKVYPVTEDIYFECEVNEGFSIKNISLQAQYKVCI